MAPAPILKAINSAIETLLRTDPSTRNKLDSLSGKSIQTTITTLKSTFTLQFEQRSLSLIEPAEEFKADVEVNGSLTSLLKLLNEDSSASASGVEISGDAGLLLQISRIASQLEIDWEALLAEKIGDVPANIAGRTAKQAKFKADELKSVLEESTRDWAQNKQTAAVTRTEFEQARKEVRQLQMEADRMEAKIRALQSENLTENHTKAAKQS